MNLFKKKISYNDFTILVYQFGLSIFNSSKKYFKDNLIIVNDCILFVVLETSISTLFNKELNNQLSLVDDVNKIVYEAFDDSNKDAMITYYVYIKDEIYDLINHHIYIKDFVNYILNEITDSNNHNINIDTVAFLCNVFENINNEINSIVSKIKIIN